MSLTPPRVVITGHKTDGTSVFTADKISKPLKPYGQTSSSFNTIHSSASLPVSNTAPLPDLSNTLPKCPQNGVLFYTADFAPYSSAPMRRSTTVDYTVILSGEAVVQLDGGMEKVLKAGECIVQRGTNHVWENRTGEWCRAMFVMVASKEIELADGTRLTETQTNGNYGTLGY